MCRLSIAATNSYATPADRDKAVARLRAQGFRGVRVRNPGPGEFLAAETMDAWGSPVYTVAWRAPDAPPPFKPAPEPRQAAPREVASQRQREEAILAELWSGPKTRADILFAIRKIASEGTMEDALQSLLDRGEIAATVEKHGRHRFERVDVRRQVAA